MGRGFCAIPAVTRRSRADLHRGRACPRRRRYCRPKPRRRTGPPASRSRVRGHPRPPALARGRSMKTDANDILRKHGPEALCEAFDKADNPFANGRPRSANGKGTRSNAAGHTDDGVSLEDFCAYMPMHSYIFKPTRDLWPASSVNSRIAPVPLLEVVQDISWGPSSLRRW